MFHDGCTAGPLSGWLNGMIGACCDLHDFALDHSYDLGTFLAGNWQIAQCVWAIHPWLAPAVFLAVSGPVGIVLYLFGPKRRSTNTVGMAMAVHASVVLSGGSHDEAQALIEKINAGRADQGKPPL